MPGIDPLTLLPAGPALRYQPAGDRLSGKPWDGQSLAHLWCFASTGLPDNGSLGLECGRTETGPHV